MIDTSSYNNWQSTNFKTCSISGDYGKSANYQGKNYPELAPKLSFWQVWHDNIGKISEEKNNRYYIQEYWNQVLSKLDPKDVYRELNDHVLLCYEPNDEFCHRHIVAAWFEILLGVKVEEKKAQGCEVESLERPEYIKKYLEDAMRQNRNMRGFTSLRALYLFEKSEKYESAGEGQMACYLRCQADMAEDEYREQKNKNIQKIKVNK